MNKMSCQHTSILYLSIFTLSQSKYIRNIKKI